MTEYAIQIVSKSTGNESFKRFEASSKESALNAIIKRYSHANHFFGKVLTKSDFLRRAWNYGSGGSLIEHAHYEMVWGNGKSGIESKVSEESWQRNLGKPWKSLSKGFKEAFEAVTWGHIEKVN